MLSWCLTWLGIHSPGKYPGGKELFPIKRKIPLEKLENVTSQWMPSMEEKTFPCWWLETFGYSWFQASRNVPFLFLSFFALFSVSLKEVILKLSMQWFTNSSCWSLLPDGPAAFISPASWRCWGCDWGLGRNAHQHESSVEGKSKLCLNVEKSPTVCLSWKPQNPHTASMELVPDCLFFQAEWSLNAQWITPATVEGIVFMVSLQFCSAFMHNAFQASTPIVRHGKVK